MSEFKANVTNEEIDSMHEQSDRIFFASGLNFLRAHNGWRPGAMHVIMGTAGGGKSTLVRTLIWDLLYLGRRVGLVLSEESKAEFLSEFCRVKDLLASKKINIEHYLETLRVLSEQDLKGPKSGKDLLTKIHFFAQEENVEILFFDNITTSICYADRKTDEQFIIANKLKHLCKDLKIPLVLIAHSGAQATDSRPSMIEMNDIRGSKAPVNVAEFFYILQTIFVDDKRYVYLRTTKHRGQQPSDTLHQLFYSATTRCFAKDEMVPFHKFKEDFKRRNRL